VYSGTFYFIEPKSTTLLNYNTYRIYRNKYDALIDLDPTLNNDFMDSGIPYDDNWSSTNLQYDYLSGLLPEDLMITPIEAHIMRPHWDKRWNNETVSKLPQIKHYAGRYFGLYAMGFHLDNLLYAACKKLKIDVIILKDMIGNQLSMELFDSRDRDQSYNSLIFTNKIQ
jgi:hypothetical protein